MPIFNSKCPNCFQEGKPDWAWFYLGWPRHATCTKCKAAITSRVSPWLSVLAQMAGSVVLLCALLSGLSGRYILGGFLTFVGFAVLVFPLLLGKPHVAN